DDRDPVLRSEAGARRDQPGMSLGDRHGDPGSHQRTLPGAELVALAGDEVEAGVAWVGPGGECGVVAKPRDRDFDHAADTRKRAKRRTSRSGSRARIRTPSSRSVRDSIGGPSAYSSASLLPSEYGSSSSTSSKRCAKRSATRARSSSSPSPVRAETWTEPGKRFASRRRR